MTETITRPGAAASHPCPDWCRTDHTLHGGQLTVETPDDALVHGGPALTLDLEQTRRTGSVEVFPVISFSRAGVGLGRLMSVRVPERELTMDEVRGLEATTGEAGSMLGPAETQPPKSGATDTVLKHIERVPWVTTRTERLPIRVARSPTRTCTRGMRPISDSRSASIPGNVPAPAKRCKRSTSSPMESRYERRLLGRDQAGTTGSVGHAAPVCWIRILDADRNEVDTGAVGEIAVSAPAMAIGYVDSEAAWNPVTYQERWPSLV